MTDGREMDGFRKVHRVEKPPMDIGFHAQELSHYRNSILLRHSYQETLVLTLLFPCILFLISFPSLYHDQTCFQLLLLFAFCFALGGGRYAKKVRESNAT